MHIWTDSPIAEIWQQLRYFRSPANVRHVLNGTTTSERLDRWPHAEVTAKAEEIGPCIEQADQYFHASRAVGLATKPLLQFYGVEALAKAVILASDRAVRLRDLKYHGLMTRPSTDPLRAYSENPDAWTLEDEFAVTNEGVFSHLARVAEDRLTGTGAVLRFRELVAMLPDLAPLYHRYYGEWPNCLRLCEAPEPAGIRFSLRDRSAIERIFPELASSDFTAEGRHDHPGYHPAAPGASFEAFGRVEPHSVCGDYFVRRHLCGIAASVSVLFAASFILSNIVRYKPAFWVRVLQGGDTGAVAIAEAVCNAIERGFPHEALERLWNERFTFGAPAYLG